MWIPLDPDMVLPTFLLGVRVYWFTPNEMELTTPARTAPYDWDTLGTEEIVRKVLASGRNKFFIWEDP